jgi:hypothetical protein
MTFAVFVGVYVGTKLEPRAGAVDGKLMVALAAFAPLALCIGFLLQVEIFAQQRMRDGRDLAILGVWWLYIACLIDAIVHTPLFAFVSRC